MKRIRALLIAEACNPRWVSVPLVGWSHAHALSRLVDAHLVTQVRNRDAILEAGLQEGRDFTAIDSEAIAARAYHLASLLRGGEGKGWTTTSAVSGLAYPYFEHLVWKRFGRQIRRGDFDVVHRITPLSPTISSILARKCHDAGVPFVLGPLNGGVPWPWQFDSARRQEKEWLSYVREIYRLLPGFHSTRRNSSAILIGSRDTWRQMSRSYRAKCAYLPENAIEPSRFTARRAHQASLPIRAIFIGRLVPYKGADMLIEAAAPLVRAGTLTIDIIGDGPQMPDLRATVASEQLQSGVRLDGWVEHSQLQNRLAEADVLAFPSIREFGGGVVLEAMAVGVVPLIVNYGGPAELVTPATGFTIELGSRQEIVERLRAALSDLVANPQKIDDRSDPAIERVQSLFTWEAKAAQVLQIYRWILGQSDKPLWATPNPLSRAWHP